MTGIHAPRRQATTAELVAASNVLAFVAPDQVRLSPFVPKVWWAYDQTTPAVLASAGVDSITDDGTGLYTVAFSDDFASTAYAMAQACDIIENSLNDTRSIAIVARAVGSIQVETVGGARADCEYSAGAIWGTLA